MPPTFIYWLGLVCYSWMVAIGLCACFVLLFIPSWRSFAIRFGAAILGSIPGVFICQILAAVPIVALLYCVHILGSGWTPPPILALALAFSIMLPIFSFFAMASIFGMYAGGMIAYGLACGMTFRDSIQQVYVFKVSIQRITQWIAGKCIRRPHSGKSPEGRGG